MWTSHPSGYDRIAHNLLAMDKVPLDIVRPPAVPLQPALLPLVVGLPPSRVALLSPSVVARAHTAVGRSAGSGHLGRPTAGVIATLFALDFCASVDLYGFSWGSGDQRELAHYWRPMTHASHFRRCRGPTRICGGLSSKAHNLRGEFALFHALRASKLVGWHPDAPGMPKPTAWRGCTLPLPSLQGSKDQRRRRAYVANQHGHRAAASEPASQPPTPPAMLPSVGLGLGWQDDAAMGAAIAAFAAAGGRMLDTAINYRNHGVVRAALKKLPLETRAEMVVVSKLAKYNLGYNNALRAVKQLQMELGMAVLDIVLIHHPLGAGRDVDTWRALAEAKAAGSVRRIGVCNMRRADIEALAVQRVRRPLSIMAHRGALASLYRRVHACTDPAAALLRPLPPRPLSSAGAATRRRRARAPPVGASLATVAGALVP